MGTIGRMLKQMEKWIEDKIIGGLPGGNRPLETLEIRKAILKEISERIERLNYDRQTFPFNQLSIFILAVDEDRQAILDDAFVAQEKLKKEIIKQLSEAKCEIPEGLHITVELTGKSEENWLHTAFHIIYKRRKTASIAVAHNWIVRLKLEKGFAREVQYTLTEATTYLGREASDDADSSVPIRHNTFSFLENNDAINESVSNKHAHIKRDSQTGDYLIFDDRSLNGTRILRNAQNIAIYPNRRGVALCNGDKIYLGKACLAVEIAENPLPGN
jgi:hypothetical protein